ncbi:MAG TPA: asparagine synthase (glutamine-hydrolyzing) [Thermoanaerobaculaceae bacterium]|nr:asparagine synthase (glutamine-hydrolyzing) [Thermoanaerobaculaceae bacterium]HRS15266.1 asparagine synthase (glutamine-hydrolyzing) [Thermoanaerobaculaceae bacterium]
MCGIVGLWFQHGEGCSADELQASVVRMRDAIVHRGPDDAGVWVDAAAGIGLGHRRLSIIDLSPLGHQPMLGADGRLVMVFNGEVYNFGELREELEQLGHRFRGSSDSEVMLAAFSVWGVEAAVRRFVGMFALALWDRQERTLTLVRDRLGKKPLYWGRVGSALVFASELKAVCALKGFPRRIDRRVVPLYLRYGYVPSPLCMYEGMHALEPGCILRLRAGGDERHTRFWDLGEVLRQARSDPFRGSEEEAAEELERVLRDAVRLRMISDVPLGAFLSGGLDSSLVVALMQAQSPRPVRTFTIGFTERLYDESAHAEAIARRLGTDHTTMVVTPREALDVVPRLPEMYDEPFADSSQIPTHLVSALARSRLTVALSGDGGDELLGGYTRYADIARDWRRREKIPAALRRLASGALELATRPPLAWSLAALLPLLWLRGKRGGSLAERVRRRGVLLADMPFARYYTLHGSFALNPEPELWLASVSAAEDKLLDPARTGGRNDVVEQMMALDLGQYLPDDILVKVDRASMAVALETRGPLLDHRVVELCWRFPLACKTDGVTGKRLLRRVLGRHLPRPLWDRPKMGFGMPFGEWLVSDLRGWAEELLGAARLGESGLWCVASVRRAWREQLSGVHDHRNLLWPVLMFEAWRRCWRAG